MKRNKIFSLMAAAMTMAACSTSDITDDTRGNDNCVRVASANVTRSGETAEPMTDDFYLINMTQEEKTDDRYDAVFSYNNGGWTSAPDVLWYGSGANEFMAYYPVKTTSGTKLTPIENINRFMIPQDQTAKQDSIADWMRASASASKKDNNGSLSLNFNHMLTQVTIVCDYSDYTDDGDNVTVNAEEIFTRAQYCEATADGIIAYQNSKYGDEGIYVKCDATDAGSKKTSSTVIIAPGNYSAKPDGSIYNGFAQAYIRDADGNNLNDITINLPNNMTLEAGKHYTFNVNIKGHDKATISAVTVSDWKNETLQDGTAKKIPPYITFSAESRQSFKMTTSSSYTLPDFEYSVGNGEWTKVVKDTEVSFGGSLGDLRLRGKSPNGTAASFDKYSRINFTNTTKVKCTGDIRTLVDYDNYNTVDTKNARFCNLFWGCTQLTTAPELPATTLASYCYCKMFYECTALTKAPEKLPATALAQNCYSTMFNRCTALTTAPELPATTLAEFCYIQMFQNCTSLTTVPQKLPAMTLQTYCYKEMFDNCTSLKKAPELPATTLATYCYLRMFNNCTSLTTVPKELPAKTLQKYCYNGMFYNCTSLTTAPELPATTLAYQCYQDMLRGCTALTSVMMMAPAEQITYDNFHDWLSSAGTSASARTLKLDSKKAYTKLSEGDSPLTPKEWHIGNATVTDENGNEITE